MTLIPSFKEYFEVVNGNHNNSAANPKAATPESPNPVAAAPPVDTESVAVAAVEVGATVVPVGAMVILILMDDETDEPIPPPLSGLSYLLHIASIARGQLLSTQIACSWFP